MMEKKTITSCPYCGETNKNLFRFTHSESRKVVCKSCQRVYKVWTTLYSESRGLKEELLKAIPREKVGKVKNAMEKYVKYHGKGGYENSRDIDIAINVGEHIDTTKNAVVLSLKGRAYYYGAEYRTVRVFVEFDDIDYEVDSEYTWKQRNWWHGETLEECVENYIKHALVEWRTI